ncbi:alpha-ketoglutarate-dependent dioxygenase AlkB [Croceicoccus gelatinilyticus]|uniref:alpha-ketoglutarate-dependent dioxygenase AlkB n=1 Tax=Croceicoccus gelatinilyticus TaxID=2835536 RepID=UPI001BCC1B4B|nr:alpha-ketoglutarate-dependent dioxygenase AlkB [Croceicoccus gelatinilyticus]MBS7671012.1 alpha-ketoglutarate-dependent dioxygenase AlkB [Croceicoccus gelatinilyticus]
MTSQFDLFDDEDVVPPVPGLSLLGRLVDAEEGARLSGLIDATGLAPFRFQQWTGKRMTRSFGWHYDFEGGGIARAEAMPDWLAEMRQCVVSAFGDDPAHYEQALLIRYDPGAEIGWHRDRPQFGRVIGLSLGAPATMRLRKRSGSSFERAAFELEPGYAYRLDGPARREWEHSIVPMEQPRWSITYRTLA